MLKPMVNSNSIRFNRTSSLLNVNRNSNPLSNRKLHKSSQKLSHVRHWASSKRFKGNREHSYDSNWDKLLCAGSFLFVLQSDGSGSESEDTTNVCTTYAKPLHERTHSLVGDNRVTTTTTDKQTLKFASGVSVIPHPQKVAKGGEDAYFITENVVGVADGVGGWADQGIDPSLYSKKLMEGSKQAADSFKENLTNPRTILWEGYHYAKETTGSSTACVACINGNELHAVNVGDTGLLVVRQSQVVFRSKEQQYTFNFPYQLGTASDISPDHGDYLSCVLQEGDLVILGSDGLFDNLYDDEIVEYCKITTEDSPETSPQQIAEQIASAASVLSRSWFRNSPFASNAAKHGHQSFFGGKVDDITVIVCKVAKQ